MFDFTLGPGLPTLRFSWSSKQSWVWAPSRGVGLLSYQIWVGYSYRLCATIDLVYFVGRTLL